METRMYRSLKLATVAAFSVVAASGDALADARLTVDGETICRLLEAAHESTCAEFPFAEPALPVAAVLPPASLVDSSETTGSIGPDTPFLPRSVPVRR